MGDKPSLMATASLIVILLLGVCGPALAVGELTTVDVSGTGSDEQSAVISGKAAAVFNVISQSPEEFSNEKFHALLRQTIGKSAEDFALEHEIIHKRHEQDEYAARHPELELTRPGLLTLQLAIKVDATALKTRWDELSDLLEKKTPVVLILGVDTVDGQSKGESVSADHIASVLRKFSVETLTKDDLPQGTDLAWPVTNAQAIAIAGELKADMVIVAQAKSVPDKKYPSRQETTVEISRLDGDKPIETFTSSLIAVTGPEVDDLGRRQRVRQSRLILPDTLNAFFKAWPGAVANSVEQTEQKKSSKQAEVE